MDGFHLAGFGAGVFVLVVAAISMLRATLTLNHLALFAIGAVLAGVPYIHVSGPDVSVDVGQLQQAATANTKAAANQNIALASLDDRLNTLTELVTALSKARVLAGGGANPQANGGAPGGDASLQRQLFQLRKSAATTSESLRASRTFNATAAVRLKLPPAELQTRP